MSVTGDERGQAIIEFALILPVLLAAAFAIVLVTQVGIARLALQHATAEGARAGALTNDDDAVRETVAAAVAPLPEDLVVTEIEPSANARATDPRGSLLIVRSTYELALPLGAFPRIRVGATAVRRIEWTP